MIRFEPRISGVGRNRSANCPKNRSLPLRYLFIRPSIRLNGNLMEPFSNLLFIRIGEFQVTWQRCLVSFHLATVYKV